MWHFPFKLCNPFWVAVHGGQHHWEPRKFDPQILGAPSVPDWIFSAPLTWRLPSSSWIKTSNASRNNLEKILKKGFQVVPGRGGRSFKRKMCSLHAKKKLAYRNVAARTETMPDGNNVFQTSPHGSCAARNDSHVISVTANAWNIQCSAHYSAPHGTTTYSNVLVGTTFYRKVLQCVTRYYSVLHSMWIKGSKAM